MIYYYYKSEEESSYKTLSNAEAGCWIHLEDPTSDDMRYISELIHIEEDDLTDSLDRYEIPRVEKIEENVLFFARHPTEFELGLYTLTLTLILTPHYVITISPKKSKLIELFLNAKTLIPTYHRLELFCQLLMRITEEFTRKIRMVRYKVLKQETDITSVESDDIASLTKEEEELNQYYSTLVPWGNALTAFSSGRFIKLFEDARDLLEDLLNASKQSELLCLSNIKSIRSLRDSYQIIFTNKLNKTMKLLTSLTIILTFPTIIASLYGMNVDLPISKSPYAFVIILGITIAISAGVLLIFRARRWL